MVFKRQALASPHHNPLPEASMFAEFLFAGALALGGWGVAGCGPVGPSSYEWRKRPDEPSRSYLFENGIQIAGSAA